MGMDKDRDMERDMCTEMNMNTNTGRDRNTDLDIAMDMDIAIDMDIAMDMDIDMDIHGYGRGRIFVDVGHRIAPKLGYSDIGIKLIIDIGSTPIYEVRALPSVTDYSRYRNKTRNVPMSDIADICSMSVPTYASHYCTDSHTVQGQGVEAMPLLPD